MRLLFERVSVEPEGFETHGVKSELDAELRPSLASLAQAQGVSLQVLLLACWKVLVWRWTGRTETVVETAFHQRKYGELRGAHGQYS